METKHDKIGRRPRERRVPSGKQVSPTERDIIWFQVLHQHGPLPTSYLHEFTKHLCKNRKRAIERATDLFHDGGYLSRPEQQFATLDARQQDLVHDLTDASKAVLVQKGLWQEHAPSTNGPWTHKLMTACITASVEIATYDNPNINFIPHHAVLNRAPNGLRATFTITHPQTGKRVDHPLIPDALFVLEYVSGGEKTYRLFIVEADRNTEPGVSFNFNRKSYLRSIQQYHQFIYNGLYKDHYGFKSGALVLNVMNNETRMNNIMRVVADSHPKDKGAYMLFKAIPNFEGYFKPPKPMPHLFTDPWDRSGHDPFFIDRR